MNRRNAILVLIVGAVAMSLLLTRQRDKDTPAVADKPAPQPTYLLTNATVIETADTGKPLYRMSAASIEQNMDDQSIRLNQLKLGYSLGNDRNWILTADSGFIPGGSRRIDLRGHVQIAGKPQPDSAPALVQTSRLLVDTETRIASTDQRVDLLWGKHRLSATGLEADLMNERLRLKSAVHGRFVR